MKHKFLKYYNTLKYLRFQQWYYRFYYLFRNKFVKKTKKIDLNKQGHLLNFKEIYESHESYSKGRFTFLNLSWLFQDKIDWNFTRYGKLWTYNLTYFDYLRQNSISKTEGKLLIYEFIKEIKEIRDGLMPFPISLRGVNWIIFLSKHHLNNAEINTSLYAQYKVLANNIEYHILGNHLLENGFSLLFGAYYFRDEKLYKKAYNILTKELKEQILDDGAHFELSPMYHQIMLLRVLDCINLLKHNAWKQEALLSLFEEKASIMLGWLEKITYKNGDIPLFNDSTNHIAPSTQKLMQYAKALDISLETIELKECGYRKIIDKQYECVVDVGNIGPDYIPGHAHSDTFNFELYVNGNPCIVDTGISTYETNDRRTLERSTSSHNTVEINSQNQTQVWGGFRVAKRAKITELKEYDNTIVATHDGYKDIGCYHTRKWEFHTSYIKIYDIIKGNEGYKTIAYLHFHPDIKVEINKNNVVTPLVDIMYEGAIELNKIEYSYAREYNTLSKATAIEVKFKNNLNMEIHIK
jgi:hypothetical protein